MGGIFATPEFSGAFEDDISGQCVVLQSMTLVGATHSERVLEVIDEAANALQDVGIIIDDITRVNLRRDAEQNITRWEEGRL